MVYAIDTLLRGDSLRRATEQLFLSNAHFSPMPEVDTLLRGDSLRRVTEQLFLTNAHFSPMPEADTLYMAPPPITATDLFGPRSELVTEAGIDTLSQFTENPLFQSLVLVLAIVYALLLYYYGANIRSFFVRTSTDSNYSDGRSSGYSHFLNLTCTLGLMMIGTLGVKCIGMIIPTGSFPANAAAGISLITTTALLIMVLMQSAVLSMIGLTTFTLGFIRELNFIRRTALAVMTIITAPSLLFYLLSPINNGNIWAYIMAIEVTVITLIFLRKSLMLFLSKKISILHWILYLCTIEIFPISLLWLLITRQ